MQPDDARNQPPYTQPSPISPGRYLPPWWSFILMMLVVFTLVAGLVMMILALGGREAPGGEPILIVQTAPPDAFEAASDSAAPATTPLAPVNAAIPAETYVMAGPTIAPPPMTPTPETISLGRTIIVIDVGDQQLNVRDAPGVLQTGVVFRAPEGTSFTVTDGPLQADGLTWWYIQDPNNSTRSGWAAANYLQPIPDETEQ